MNEQDNNIKPPTACIEKKPHKPHLLKQFNFFERSSKIEDPDDLENSNDLD